MNVRSLMLKAVETWGEREAVVAGQYRLTFAQAWNRGLRLANILLEMGLRPGDRVAVLEDNSVEAVDFFLACTAANLVRVPLYARNSREGHTHMVSHTGSRVLVVTQHYLPDVAGLDEELRELERIFVRDDTYEDLLEKASDHDPDPSVSSDDLYIIRHTAGTTGRPKGLPISHRQWLASERDWFYSFPPVELDDACLHIGPISHGSGYFFMPTWISGGRNVLVDKFDPAGALDIMEREDVAFMFVVPTMLAQLARHPSASERDWSALKAINFGGAPSAESTLLSAREVFGDVLYQTYGQSEVLPATTLGPREMFAEIPGSRPIRSAGRAYPFAELRILDPETHEPLPVDQEGEIAVHTDGQITGFWNDPEASANRIIDGWVLTGDIGKLDQNGYLYVLDRATDMIISGGFNIWPAELENVIAEHPAVLEVAVFGIPDERWGETPAAVCVVDDTSEVHEAEIIELCRSRLGSYKKPSKVVITADALPKSPVGKVLRKALREPYWAGQERRVAGN